jgi:ubiquinone/menaquinone biosynthesis C-methylase UbiE
MSITMTNTEAWDRVASHYVAQRHPHSVRISYGRDLPDDAELRLVPNLRDKRVLELGCGGGSNAVVMAKAGAKVIAIDASQAMLDIAEAHATTNKTKVEFHHGDLAELAWLRAESIEFALSVGVLAEVEDLDRALRQVHRVLRAGSSFVFTHAHPTGLCCRNDYERDGGLPLGTLEVRRSYFDEQPMLVAEFDETFRYFPRTLATIFAALGRAGFAVDTLLEPEPVASASLGPTVPAAIIIRAKKLGN